MIPLLLLILLLIPVTSEACQQFTNVVQDRSGNVVPGASVTVRPAGLGSNATIYSDENCAVPQTNPVTTDNEGRFTIWLTDGKYDFTFAKTGYDFAPITSLGFYDPLGENSKLVSDYQTSLGVYDICATGTGAIDQIGATPTTLVINRAVTCTLSKTVPSTLALRFEGSGQVTVSSTKTLTINGYVYAPFQQIFAGSGLVTLIGQDVQVAWWGTDYTAINKAIVANTTSNRFASVHLTPNYSYTISGTINFSELSRGVFDGHGATLTWGGNASDPMFLLSDVRDTVFRHFTIQTSTTTPLAIGVKSENGSGATVAPAGNYWEYIVMDGTNGGIGKGWALVGTGGGGNNNNSENVFYHTIVNNYTTCAYSFEHSQSKAHVLFHAQFAGNSTGERGVCTSQGSSTQGGSFSCYNCQGGGNSVADFDIGSPNDYINIWGGNFENSARLFTTQGASGSNFPVTIQGVRWGISTNLAANNRAIVYNMRGPLILMGNSFEPATAGKALEVYFAPGGDVNGTFTAIGNYFGSTLTNPFTGFFPTTARDNLINRNDANGDVKLGLPPWSFTNGDTTPSVQSGDFYKEVNSGGTSITTFDDGYEGQRITIYFTTANTTIVDGATIQLAGGANFVGSSEDMLVLEKRGTVWVEISRSVN